MLRMVGQLSAETLSFSRKSQVVGWNANVHGLTGNVMQDGGATRAGMLRNPNNKFALVQFAVGVRAKKEAVTHSV